MCTQCGGIEKHEDESFDKFEMTSDEDIMGLLQGDSQPKDNGEPIMFREPLELDDPEITEIYNSDEYIEGVKIGARLSGIYTTLLNFGVDIMVANTVVMNQQAIDSNERIAKINSNMNVEMSKNQILQADKNNL